MKLSQYEEIAKSLKEYRDINNIDMKESRKEFLGRFLYIFKDYIEAESDLIRVDILCKLMVDLFNSENIDMNELNNQTDYGTLLEQMFSVFTRKIIEEDVWSVSDLNRICFFIEKLGFSPYECVLEKLKELNSKDSYKAEYK